MSHSDPAFAAGIAKDEVVTSRGSQVTMEGSDKVLYKNTPQGDLYLFVFKPALWKNGDMRPVIVFFHGGGFKAGTPMQFERQCRYFTSRGMVAVTVEYRLASLHQTSPRESVADAKSSIRWVRSHAAELGIDPGKLIASGGSAGGFLAACAGTATGGDDTADDTSVSCVPDALALYNPVVTGDVGVVWDDIIPVNHVEKGAPPAFILAGKNDTITPPAKCRLFADAMKVVGSRCDLHVYADAGHGFFNAEPFYTVTTHDVDVFLASLGYISGLPAIGR